LPQEREKIIEAYKNRFNSASQKNYQGVAYEEFKLTEKDVKDNDEANKKRAPARQQNWRVGEKIFNTTPQEKLADLITIVTQNPEILKKYDFLKEEEVNSKIKTNLLRAYAKKNGIKLSELGLSEDEGNTEKKSPKIVQEQKYLQPSKYSYF
jgi:hypothetical protein